MDFIAEGFIQGLGLLFSLDEETWSTVWNSLRASSLSIMASITLGMPAGFMIGFFTFPGRDQLRTISDTLLALPTVVVGLLVYAFLTHRGPLGSWELLYTIRGISIAQTILVLPIVVSFTASAAESLDRNFRPTMATLGVGRIATLLYGLYEIRFSLVTAALMAYGRAVSEVGISMMIGGNIKWNTRTITTAIALESGKGDFARGIALGVILMTIVFLVNILARRFRRMEE
jgi:tungstate transport system permease protein